MDALLLGIVLVLYLTSAASFVAYLGAGREPRRSLGPMLLAAGAALHGLEIAERSFMVGHIAVASFDEGLSFLAFSLVILYLLIDRRHVLTVLGAVIVPLAALLVAISALVSSGTTALPPALRSAWLPVHVTLAFLGNAVFALAFATSLVYLFEDGRLKSKRPALRRRLFPSLEKLDDLNHRLLAWGFPLLTLGIVTGAIWAHLAWGEFWSWEARQTWSLVTWSLYALLLHGRSVGWRGRRAATLTIVGFAVLVMSFVSVNLFFPGRHAGSFGS
ncbi:MAG: c-type cytochrome biogenesis protein CcsB [Deltaproteobacteria bacterium]|nr:c-type cytochrome biogenesis protein CcsB [Deltaproteobacteria bacterium]